MSPPARSFRYALVQPSGDVEIGVHVPTSDHGCLTWLRQQVGGDIEAVTVDGQRVGLYVDDEGLLNGKPPNPVATRLWHAAPYGQRLDVICGPALFFGLLDASGVHDGYEHDLPGDWEARIREHATGQINTLT